jgi:hypothetical protein
VPVKRQPDGTFRLAPAGYPGSYDVYLSSNGPDGSASFMFEWTTTKPGVRPEPTARLAVITSGGGTVEMAIDHLARTPEQVDATITVTAANGKNVKFTATQAQNQCRSDGSLYWDGPAPSGTAAAALGPQPFRYDVTLVIDGASHTATATWPHDQIVGNEPSVALNFEPPLPGLT